SFEEIVQSSHEPFVKIMAIIFTLTSEERIIIQYTNVLFGFSVVFVIYLIFNLLEIEDKYIYYGTIAVTFFINSVIFSSILLREIIPTFFLVLGIYYLVKWYVNYKKTDFYLSIMMVLVGALFHSG